MDINMTDMLWEYWGVGLGWGLIYTFHIGFGFKVLPPHFVEY